MTLMLGLVPCAIVVASFKNSHAVWKIGVFDIVCGAIAIAGLVFWAFVNEPTVALVSFVCADRSRRCRRYANRGTHLQPSRRACS